LAVKVTTDGKNIVSASTDKTIKIWDLISGQERRTLQGHTKDVCAVDITADGKYIVSASWDKTIKVWDLQSGKEITTFTGEASFYCCAIAPDGRTIVAGDYSGKLHFLSLENLN